MLALILTAGCSEGEPAPAEESPREEAAVEAPAADSIEVVDDERSLERRIQDAAIATQVRIALVDASELRRFDFDPEVENGRLVLRGEVNTQSQRSRAEAIAKEVQGVRGVSNQITAVEEPVVASASEDAASADTSDQLAQAKPETAEPQTPPPAEETETEPEPQPQQQQKQETYHTVKSGESLWTISRNYGVTIEQIRRLNNLSSNNLRPGQRLQVK